MRDGYLLIQCNIYSHIMFVEPDAHLTPIRTLTAAHMGKLVCVRGLVTAVQETRPLLVQTGYLCTRCGVTSYESVPYDTRRSLPPRKECENWGECHQMMELLNREGTFVATRDVDFEMVHHLHQPCSYNLKFHIIRTTCIIDVQDSDRGISNPHVVLMSTDEIDVGNVVILQGYCVPVR